MAIALELNVFDNHTEYFLSCFGSPQLDEDVKLVFAPGCSQHRVSTPETYKRIYLAKWTALVEAFSMTKRDMLLVDLDAVLMRNPRGIFSDHSQSKSFYERFGTPTPAFDIISSTDHGHDIRHFPFAHNWGDIRLCTGFIFFRYSLEVEALLRVVLAYQSQFGQVCTVHAL